MPPGTASYKRLYRRVAAALGALQASTYSAATPTLNDRRRPVEGFIRDAIVNKDAAVRLAICTSEKSPHRVRYLDWSADLDHGDELPEHYGPPGAVRIKLYSGAAGYEAGIEADSVEQINLWRENPGSMFGSVAHNANGSLTGGHFKIESGSRLYLTGYKGQVELASFDISAEGTDPPVLGAPDAFEDVIFAGAVGDSPMEGDDFQQTGYLRDYYAQTLPMILAGAYEVPPLQQK